MDTNEGSTSKIDTLKHDVDVAPRLVDLDEAERFLDHADPDVRSKAAYVFKEIAKSDPQRAADYLTVVAPRLDDRHETTRYYAVCVFKGVVDEAPRRVVDHLNALEPRLNDEKQATKRTATYIFKEIAKEVPGRASDYLDALEPRLDDPSDNTRNFATFVFNEVAKEDPQRASDYLDALEPRLDDPSDNTRNFATFVFKEVAKEDPHRVRDYLDALEPRLDDQSDNTRNFATFVFKEVAKEDPQRASDYLDALEPRLDDTSPNTRDFAAYTFSEVVEISPQRVGDYLDSLEPCLSDDSENTRNFAVCTFNEVSKENPQEVSGNLDQLEAVLHDSEERNRELAIDTIANVAGRDCDRISPYLPSIVPLLVDGNETVEDRAGSCLATVAGEAPEQLREVLRTPEADQFEEAAVEQVEAILAANAPEEVDRLENSTEVTRGVEDQPPDEIPNAPDVEISVEAVEDEQTIGQGGNADVVAGTIPRADGTVQVAIKRPRMSGTVHGETIDRLLEEAETWDRLDSHEHVVGVVDWGSKPVPWIGMEYMDGGHLGDRVAEMGLAQKLWTAIAVTEGVLHAHRHGVVHLDLKPENILFRAVEDAWDVPKVADWGLSKRLLEHSQSVEGLSPQYAAPEQFDDEYGSSDHSTDIYQLGAVFYELFTGRPPFDGKPSKAMYRILEEKPTPPSEIADIPGRLDDVLLTALAKPKDERYNDILYLRDALQTVRDEL